MEQEEVKKLIKKLGVDDVHYIYTEGQKSMRGHESPSQKTMEEINNLKINMVDVTNKLDRNTEKLDFIKENLTDHISKENSSIEKVEIQITTAVEKMSEMIFEFQKTAETKFTSKWVEHMIVGAFKIGIVPVMGGVMWALWELIKVLAKR